MNPIKKLDDAMLYLADKAVHAYNWTTGRTRASLANSLEMAGLGAYSAKLFYSSPIVGAALAPIFVLGGLIVCSNNNLQDRKEKQALERECLDFEVEERKSEKRAWGLLFTGVTAITAAGSIFGPDSERAGNILSSAATFSLALAQYAMRVGSPPPRKNCIRRGYEKLKELAGRVKDGIRAPSPTPSFALDVPRDVYQYLRREK